MPDPIAQGLARGWRVLGAERALPDALNCDVVVIGTGAGGGVTAELMSRAGLSVVMVEEGPLRSSRDFHQQEADAYPQLYQESAARKTADKGITILQGRCVGGSTTVNWTSSFRTPPDTLTYWRQSLGLTDLDESALRPYFEQVERRLSIDPWLVPPNENNDLLRRGAQRLGMEADVISRNVSGCWNLGSCGLGCPTNAKQSMLVTAVPAALDAGATLLVQTRAERLNVSGGRVQSVECVPVTLNGRATGRAVQVRARHVVLAGGAINSPGLMLRSAAPDPHGRLGRRTFLHPVVMSAAVMPDRVAGWEGAPQTLYSDHFLHTQPIDGEMGFKLEAPPLHPVIFASTVTGLGDELAQRMRDFPRTHVLLALLRDGFHPESAGGQVRIRSDGSAELDYPLTPFVMRAARRALRTMAEIQFAAGADAVLPVHEQARTAGSWDAARAMIDTLEMVSPAAKVVSAHVMGGCAMSTRPADGVVRPDGRHWQLANLSVHDGSLFPTSIGANPQLSIYGLVNRLAQNLVSELGGRPVPLA